MTPPTSQWTAHPPARLHLWQRFYKGAPGLKARLAAVYGIVTVLNVGGWLWALAVLYDRPVPFGLALIVYGLGLRHAVDADHIAAIDNVTRKFMQAGGRPVSVGFFFAMGHSAIVVLVGAIVGGAADLIGKFEVVKAIGGAISTGVSALFLFAIAAMNIVIATSIYRTLRRVRAGGAYVEEDLEMLLVGRGFLARLLRPLFALVTRSWHMLPLGLLFGLGFDTATEVSMFGVSAAQAANGIPWGSILVFPTLFAAGMSLVDTTDGIVMLAAYEWAFLKPVRKLRYNLTITLMSVVVALLIGGVEALGLIGGELDPHGALWSAAADLGANLNILGVAIVGAFMATWALSYLAYRFRKSNGPTSLTERSPCWRGELA